MESNVIKGENDYLIIFNKEQKQEKTSVIKNAIKLVERAVAMPVLR